MGSRHESFDLYQQLGYEKGEAIEIESVLNYSNFYVFGERPEGGKGIKILAGILQKTKESPEEFSIVW